MKIYLFACFIMVITVECLKTVFEAIYVTFVLYSFWMVCGKIYIFFELVWTTQSRLVDFVIIEKPLLTQCKRVFLTLPLTHMCPSAKYMSCGPSWTPLWVASLRTCSKACVQGFYAPPHQILVRIKETHGNVKLLQYPFRHSVAFRRTCIAVH